MQHTSITNLQICVILLIFHDVKITEQTQPTINKNTEQNHSILDSITSNNNNSSLIDNSNNSVSNVNINSRSATNTISILVIVGVIVLLVVLIGVLFLIYRYRHLCFRGKGGAVKQPRTMIEPGEDSKSQSPNRSTSPRSEERSIPIEAVDLPYLAKPSQRRSWSLTKDRADKKSKSKSPKSQKEKSKSDVSSSKQRQKLKQIELQSPQNSVSKMRSPAPSIRDQSTQSKSGASPRHSVITTEDDHEYDIVDDAVLYSEYSNKPSNKDQQPKQGQI